MRAKTRGEYPFFSMSNEEKTSSGKPNPRSRGAAAILGAAAIAAGAAAAFFGFSDPLTGAFLLGVCIFLAVLALIGGIVFRSPQARRFSLIALGLAVLVTLAGTLSLLSNKNFEDRCVEAWKKISSGAADFERHLDRLEDRFDND